MLQSWFLKSVSAPLLAVPLMLSASHGECADQPGSIGDVKVAPVTRSAELPDLAAWRQAIDEFQRIEFFQMVRAILGGSRMGPGDGWFRDSQSRFDWKFLAARCDDNGDGEIDTEEFYGSQEAFDRLDRNGSGTIAQEDFDWSDASPFVRQQGQSRQWFSGIDRSSNGRLSREEWDAFFDRLAGEKEFVTPEDLRKALFPPPVRSRGGRPPSTLTLMKGLLAGELGSMREGPAIGDPAPEFELPTHDGQRRLSLRQFRNDKPVVLVFGSFT